MNLSELLDEAIEGGQIDTDSSQWVDFIFELLRQQPDADEITLGNLLRQRGLDSAIIRQAVIDFTELKSLLATLP